MARALITGYGPLLLAVQAVGDHAPGSGMAGSSAVVARGPVTRLPLADPLLQGLTVVGGRSVPLLNLAGLLGVPAEPETLTVLTTVQGERLALPATGTLGLLDLIGPDLPWGDDLLGPPQPLEGGAGMARPLNLSAVLEQLRTHMERA